MKIKTISTEQVHSNPYFSVNKNELQLYNENTVLEKDYYTIKSKDFITCILQKEDFVLMTNQYRYAVDKFSQEFIGGFIDEGESPEEAVKRELKEESGYVSNRFYLLGKISPLTSKCSNTGYVYYTDESFFEGKELEQWEEFVELSTTWVKVKDVRKKILNGEIFDGSTLASWTLYKEYINA